MFFKTIFCSPKQKKLENRLTIKNYFMFSIKTKYFPFSINRKHGIFKEHLLIVLYVVFTCFLRVVLKIIIPTFRMIKNKILHITIIFKTS